MQWLKQSTAVTVKIGPFLDSTDGVTAEGALTIAQADVRLSKNGGNIAQKNDATSCTHDELGVYGCPLDATDTNTLGRLQLWVAESGALPVWHEYMILPANVYDSLVSGSDYLQADAMQVEGSDATDQIRDAVVDDATRIDASALNTLSGHDPGSQLAAQSDVTGLNDPTAATIADAVWDEASAGHTDAGKAGAQLWTDIDAILADTNELQTDDVPGLIGALNNLSAAQVNAEVDTALSDYDPPTKAELDTAVANVSVDEIQASALADMFNTDSGDTYAGAVAGSVVKEIGDTAGGATADQLWDEEMDSNAPANCNTAREYMNVILAVLAGATASTGDWSAQDLGETKTRLAATLDSNGVRTSIDTLDGT